MKVLWIWILISILSVSAFSQADIDAFSYVGSVKFSDAKEKVLQISPLENSDRLLLIGKNEVRLWKPLETSVLYSSNHDIYEGQGFLRKLINLPNPIIINNDGTKGIVIAEADGKKENAAIVWDFQKGKKVAVLERGQKPTRTAEFSENGKIIVTTHGDLKDSEIAFWDAETYAYLSSIDVQDLAWVQISPDGEKVFTISGKAKKWLGITITDFKEANGIGVWNTSTGDFEKGFEVNNIQVANKYLPSPIITKDGKYLLVENEKGVSVWNTNDNLKPVYQISNPNPKEKILLAGITPDEKYFLLAEGKKIKFYNFSDGKFSKEFLIQNDERFDITKNNKYAVVRKKGAVAVINLENDDRFFYQSVRIHEEDYDELCYANCEYEIERVKLSPNGKYILIYGDKDVRVFEIANGKQLQTFTHPKEAKFKKNGKIKNNGLGTDAGWLENSEAVYIADKDRKEYLIWKIK